MTHEEELLIATVLKEERRRRPRPAGCPIRQRASRSFPQIPNRRILRLLQRVPGPFQR